MRLRIICRHTAMHSAESVRVSTILLVSIPVKMQRELKRGVDGKKICKIECPGKFESLVNILNGMQKIWPTHSKIPFRIHGTNNASTSLVGGDEWN